MTIVVLDALGEVDVASKLLAVDGAEEGAEDGNLAATLDREGNVLSRVGEVCAMLEYVVMESLATWQQVVLGQGGVWRLQPWVDDGCTYRGRPSGSCLTRVLAMLH